MKGVEIGLPICVSFHLAKSNAQLTTTAIYVDAVGEEERNIAGKLWV